MGSAGERCVIYRERAHKERAQAASASQVVVFFGELVPCPASQLTERNSTVGNGCISRGNNK